MSYRYLRIQNHGPLIVASSYWDSDLAAAGKIYCSVNAGAIRLLIPESQRQVIAELRKCAYVILSRGPWPAQRRTEAVELLFEDDTDSPYALQLSPESFDLLPAEPSPGQEWVLSAWDQKRGRPHKAVERRCLWRRAPKIPWLKPWSNL